MPGPGRNSGPRLGSVQWQQAKDGRPFCFGMPKPYLRCLKSYPMLYPGLAITAFHCYAPVLAWLSARCDPSMCEPRTTTVSVCGYKVPGNSFSKHPHQAGNQTLPEVKP